MKQLLAGIAFGVGISGLFLGGACIVLGCVLMPIAVPALCNIIYEMTPAYERKRRSEQEYFRKWMDYVGKLRAIRDNPTTCVLRKLSYDGFASNIAYMLEHHPMAYKIAYDEHLI